MSRVVILPHVAKDGGVIHRVDRRAIVGDSDGGNEYSLRGVRAFETLIRTNCGIEQVWNPDLRQAKRRFRECKSCVLRGVE
jgi:hypothetical protein